MTPSKDKKQPSSSASQAGKSKATQKKASPAPESDLESGDNVAQRETDAMDASTREGKRSIKDDGF